MLLVWAGLVLTALISGQEVSESSPCCPQVFLSSQDLLADKQAPALGIFTLASQRIANNSHPVYVKHSGDNDQDFFLYFRQSGGRLEVTAQFLLSSVDAGPQGWIVGSELLEDSYYITTNIRSDCPAGIVGGYDSDNVSHDPDFSIECHRWSRVFRSFNNTNRQQTGPLQVRGVADASSLMP